MRETRVYPTGCTSGYCGNGSDSCPDCSHYPVLKEFKEWKERTAARPAHPTWHPVVYVATRDNGSPRVHCADESCCFVAQVDDEGDISRISDEVFADRAAAEAALASGDWTPA